MKCILKKVAYKFGILKYIKKNQIIKEMQNMREVFKKQFPNIETEYFIHPTARIEKAELVQISECAEIHDYVIIRTTVQKVKIGRFTQINPFTVIYGGSGVVIGDNVMIAPHCMIASGNHDFKQTQFPMRFAGTLTKGPIVIEDNVWVGANCTITDGVKIGRESVIAANSVVTKDVEPWSIMSGVPAVKIGNRLIVK